MIRKGSNNNDISTKTVLLTFINLFCRHDTYENQYRAMFVQNCGVDASKPLKFARPADEPVQNLKKNKMQKNEDVMLVTQQELLNFNNRVEDNNYDLSYEQVKAKDFEYFFPVHCEQCKTEIGVFDFEEKIYHFFSVIPSLG